MAVTPIKLAAKTRQRLQGLQATYHRGSSQASIRVVPGRSSRETVIGDVAAQIEARDLLVIACELKLAGTAIKPQRHDRIVCQVGSESQTFEVAPLTAGAQPWEWVDVYGVELRVHVQQVS